MQANRASGELLIFTTLLVFQAILKHVTSRCVCACVCVCLEFNLYIDLKTLSTIDNTMEVII